MVSSQSVYDQLKRLHVNTQSWGRSEIRELPQILLPDEEIYECVNGIYDAGFALLVATDVRVLLIDKKPLNYLTVEDVRFDMITEIDYSHRMVGAAISISAGSKNLVFRSYNKPRLRKLISHVQHCMAEAKRQHQMQQEGQNLHLENINQQLQLYLLAQQGHERELTRRLFEVQATAAQQAPVFQPQLPVSSAQPESYALSDQLAAEAQAEIFGKPNAPVSLRPAMQPTVDEMGNIQFDPNRTAYSRVPLSLRHRNFGRAATIGSSLTKAASVTTAQ